MLETEPILGLRELDDPARKDIDDKGDCESENPALIKEEPSIVDDPSMVIGKKHRRRNWSKTGERFTLRKDSRIRGGDRFENNGHIPGSVGAPRIRDWLQDLDGQV